MKKLRLHLFSECDRQCPGCCNKDWDTDNLPHVGTYTKYDEILITGGEPLLDTQLVLDTITTIRGVNKSAHIYIYTARTVNIENFINVLYRCNGITVTLHNEGDIWAFNKLNNKLLSYYSIMLQNKSMRLNIFKNITITNIFTTGWKIKNNMKWIKNAPLPKDEVFMRL